MTKSGDWQEAAHSLDLEGWQGWIAGNLSVARTHISEEHKEKLRNGFFLTEEALARRAISSGRAARERNSTEAQKAHVSKAQSGKKPYANIKTFEVKKFTSNPGGDWKEYHNRWGLLDKELRKQFPIQLFK